MATKLFMRVDLSSAEELLDTLLPSKPGHLWNRGDDHGWIFRGQADAAWDLTPRAHRGAAEFAPFLPGNVPMRPLSAAESFSFEQQVVLNFAERASELGFEVPGDSPDLRDPDAPAVFTGGRDFPEAKVRGFYALAQHFGIPTRLLDWSKGPLTAAYFAAKGATERTLRGEYAAEGRFAVWALNREMVRKVLRRRDPNVILVTVPGHNNANLRAQQGLFTLVRYSVEDGLAQLPPPLDRVVTEHYEGVVDYSNDVVPLPNLYKFTVPAAEAGRLLYFLDRIGIDAGSTGSTLYAVVESLRESRCHVRQYSESRADAAKYIEDAKLPPRD